MTKVIPKDYAEDFTNTWMKSIIREAMDVGVAMERYKANADPHIDDVLGDIAKLNAKKLAITMRRFVEAYVHEIGVFPEDYEVIEDGTADDATVEADDDGTVDAPDDATGVTTPTVETETPVIHGDAPGSTQIS